MKARAPLILIGVATVTSAISGFAGYSASARITDNAKRRELKGVATVIQNSMAEQANKAAARASMVASLPSIQEAFRARDRETLVRRLGPAFAIQKEQYGVREGQFHLAPAISFLRIFDPKNGHGEDLSSFREMVLATNRKHEPQKGIELGRRGLSIRGVVAVADEQGPMGSFEVGMDFNAVLEGTKRDTGFECGVFVDDKLMAEAATLIPRPTPSA